MTDEPAALLAELVRFLAHQPTAAARLVTAHVDDGSGRCATCVLAGQSGRMPWPCVLAVATGAAQPVVEGVCSVRRS
jgi:hypothetical protein